MERDPLSFHEKDLFIRYLTRGSISRNVQHRMFRQEVNNELGHDEDKQTLRLFSESFMVRNTTVCVILLYVICV